MKKINELTKEQESKFPDYVNKWLEIGLCTKRANRALAERYCRDAYRSAGLEEPKYIFWAESPMGLLLTAKLLKELFAKGNKPYSEMDLEKVSDQVYAQVGAQVRDQVGAQVGAQVCDQVYAQVGTQVRAQVYAQVGTQVRAQVWDQVWDQVSDQVGAQVRAQVGAQVWDQVYAQVRAQVYDQVYDQVRDGQLRNEWNDCNSWGQHDSNLWSFYDYFREVCGLKEETEKLLPLMNLAKETGWHLFYKEIVILSEKPVEIYRDEQHRLHNLNGPAIKWNDGYSLYSINGLRVPEYICETEKENFTKEMFLKEENADFRRCISQKIGIEKTIEMLGAEVIDTYDSAVGGRYELLMIDFDNRGTKRPFLQMQNPSVKELYHIEGVSPNCRTVKDAICFRNQLIKFVEPYEIT